MTNTTLTAVDRTDDDVAYFGRAAHDEIYLDCRTNSASQASFFDSTDIGQEWNDYESEYFIYRTHFLFDLSSFSGYIITSAILKFTGYGNYSNTDFNIQVRGDTYDIIGYSYANYLTYGSVSFGSINSSSYSTSADSMTITFNSSGLTYLNNHVGGNCVLDLVSEEDMNASAPSLSSSEFIQIYTPYSSVTSTKRPHLYLEYSEASASAWTPKIMMIMSPLVDGLLEWIRKPITADKYLQI